MLLSFFIAFVALQAGCGGGSSSGQQMQTRNYNVTSSGAIQQTSQVIVMVP